MSGIQVILSKYEQLNKAALQAAVFSSSGTKIFHRFAQSTMANYRGNLKKNQGILQNIGV